MKEAKTEFEKTIAAMLDQSLEDIDSDTLVRLRRLKYQAMETVEQRRGKKMFWRIAPATVVLLLIALINLPNNVNVQPGASVPSEVALLTSAEPLEFYAEDYEFYLWCAETAAAENLLPGHSPAQPADLQGAPAVRAGDAG